MRTTRPDLATPAARSAFRRALLAWYRRSRRILPWRATSDPYAVWVSEIMLQQTRVETVVPYYERFLAVFPDVYRLAAADEQHVLECWAGLGYYRRARLLHRAARQIVAERDGVLPSRAADWQALPGIGRYTAGAIASITTGEVVPAVDGNVQRVLARLLRITAPVNHPATAARLWDHAAALVAPRTPGDYNQALMELGARVCTPRGPHCGDCPVRRWCAAAISGVSDALPVKTGRTRVRPVRAAAAAIRGRAGLLLVQRPAEGMLAGLWTLPTVELADGADAVTTLSAGLAKQLGCCVPVSGAVGVVTHQFTHRHLTLEVYAARWPVGGRLARARVPTRWVDPAAPDGPLATVDRKILALVCAQESLTTTTERVV